MTKITYTFEFEKYPTAKELSDQLIAAGAQLMSLKMGVEVSPEKAPKEKPVKEKAPEPVEQVDPSPKKELTVDDLREVVLKFARKHGAKETKEKIMGEFGVAKLDDLKKEDFAAFMKAFKS